MAGEERSFKNQNLILESRKHLSVSGVEEVDGFDEGFIRIRTCLGALTVRGQGLRVENLSVESGELSVSGEIAELIYEEPTTRSGLLKRLFG